MRHRLDRFGVLVLAFVAGNVGGIIRDVLLGALTGVGGGMGRDLLVREVPVVLTSDLYAVAALRDR